MSQFFASAGWEEATELRVRDRHAQHVSGLGSGGSLGLECHPPHGPPHLMSLFLFIFKSSTHLSRRTLNIASFPLTLL